MSFPETAIADRLVTDSEKAAFEVLPLLVGSDDARRSRYAIQLGDIMGNPGEFQRYVAGLAPERLAAIDRLLRCFMENVELLVHKTWVEKSEEKPKERLLEDLASFERDFRDGSLSPALRRFVSMAHAIANLLFGAQSRAPDFLFYCFRIDPKLGLFFWYVDELEKQVRAAAEQPLSVDLMATEVLIGVYVLSSF
jgi:hypothetical protein